MFNLKFLTIVVLIIVLGTGWYLSRGSETNTGQGGQMKEQPIPFKPQAGLK